MGKIIGVTGIMGSGKTTICKKIIETNKNINYINVDVFRLNLRESDSSFQNELLSKIDGITDLKEINKYIYANKENMQVYKNALYKHLENYLKENEDKETIIVDWALMIDDDLLDYFDKIILVTCPIEEILKRLDGSYWPIEEIKRRIAMQLTNEEKIKCLNDHQKEYIVIDNSKGIDYKMIYKFILEN